MRWGLVPETNISLELRLLGSNLHVVLLRRGDWTSRSQNAGTGLSAHKTRGLDLPLTRRGDWASRSQLDPRSQKRGNWTSRSQGAGTEPPAHKAQVHKALKNSMSSDWRLMNRAVSKGGV